MKHLRLAQKTQAYLLGILLLWFGTHHLAPGFEHSIFKPHAHASSDLIVKVSVAHPHVEHCDFCGSAGYMVLTYENWLPRAPLLAINSSTLKGMVVARVSHHVLARAPPLNSIDLLSDTRFV